jgi:integrase
LVASLTIIVPSLAIFSTTCASMAAHRGVPVQVLSATLGHRDISVTQKVYLHLFNRDSSEDAFRAAMNGGVS